MLGHRKPLCWGTFNLCWGTFSVCVLVLLASVLGYLSRLCFGAISLSVCWCIVPLCWPGMLYLSATYYWGAFYVVVVYLPSTGVPYLFYRTTCLCIYGPLPLRSRSAFVPADPTVVTINF